MTNRRKDAHAPRVRKIHRNLPNVSDGGRLCVCVCARASASFF